MRPITCRDGWTRDDQVKPKTWCKRRLVRAARYFGSFRGGSGRLWLLGVVRRVSFDWLAKQQAQAAETLDETVPERDAEANCPVFLAIRKCDQQMVRAALEELPPQLREAIVLRELEGLSYQEIAEVADVPIGTVMSRTMRGRQRLVRAGLHRIGRGNCTVTYALPVQRLLQLCSDNELDLFWRVQIESHLAECTGCAEQAQRLQVLRETIGATALRYPPPTLAKGGLHREYWGSRVR